jgi:hypothetical protein
MINFTLTPDITDISDVNACCLVLNIYVKSAGIMNVAGSIEVLKNKLKRC